MEIFPSAVNVCNQICNSWSFSLSVVNFEVCSKLTWRRIIQCIGSVNCACSALLMFDPKQHTLQFGTDAVSEATQDTPCHHRDSSYSN